MGLRIGMVARLTGLSPSGIRYYEERGIVSPSHERDGAYRSFAIADVAKLLDCRNYRACGLSTEEVADVLTTPSEIEAAKRLDECGLRIRAQIRNLENLEGFIQQRVSALRGAASTGQVDLVDSPSMYWMPLWLPDGDEASEAGIPSDDDGFAIPFADSSLIFPEQEFFPDSAASGLIMPRVGYGIQRRFASRPPRGEQVAFIPSCLALHMQVEIGEDFSLDVAQLASAKERMRKDGLVCDGRPFTHRLITSYGSRPIRIDEIWIPVRRIP